MVIFKPMVLIGMLLIFVGIYGVFGYVHKPFLHDFLFQPRAELLEPVLRKFGRDFGHTVGTIALVIGGILVVVGAIGWIKSRNEPEDPGFFSQ